MKGTVTEYSAEKGFGSIYSDDGEDVFVHESALRLPATERKELAKGDAVTFERRKSVHGSPYALNVRRDT